MNTSGSAVLLCFGVVLLAQLTMAIGGIEMELLLSKMDYLHDKLQEVEQTMKTNIEKVDSKFETRMNALEEFSQNAMKIQLQTIEASKESHKNLMAKLEKEVVERIGKMDSKIDIRVQALEDSLQKSVQTSENNTRSRLEELKNQIISVVENVHQQQNAQDKTYQEATQTELKKIEENKIALNTLSDSIRNISTLSEKNNKILEAHFSYPVRSCRQVMKLSGRYIIHVGQNLQRVEVLCEQTKFEGGWTVIQQRYDGSVDFYRNWTEYRNGFGNLNGEFWLGLEHMHQMTKNRPHELLVEIKDFHGNYGYAKYEGFEIGSESEKYVLKKLGAYSGTVGDALQRHLYTKFSSSDRDNDEWNDGMCAEDRHGAWWYTNCADSNLNGRYQKTTSDQSAMTWFYIKGDWRGLSYSRMMIRDRIN